MFIQLAFHFDWKYFLPKRIIYKDALKTMKVKQGYKKTKKAPFLTMGPGLLFWRKPTV
jgi:hypothetical protein